MGREILKGLLTDDLWQAVHVLGRRAPPGLAAHPKLTSHVVADLLDLPSLPAIDDVLIALGTTMRTAGSREAFRAVDFDATLAVARAARRAGASRLALVSAAGADAGSRIFYSRVKGETEQAIGRLNFPTLVIARPSMLDGDRAALQQAPRPAERWSLRVLRRLRPLLPVQWRPVAAESVAHALLRALQSGQDGRWVLTSDQLQAG